MIKKVIFLIFLFVSFAYSYGVYVNQTSFSLELKLEGMGKFYVKNEKSDKKLTIIFNKPIDFKSIKEIKSKLLKGISLESNKLILILQEKGDFFVKKDGDDLYVFITPERRISDIVLKSPIAKPILKTKKQIVKDKDAEKVLTEVDKDIENGLYETAINKLLDLIAKHQNDFYAQEAYYKLGMLYYRLGEKDPKNYIKASDYLSDFANKFPENYRAPDALYYSALSKEKAGMYFEAIFDYKAIIMAYPKTSFAKKSYLRIADIYENIGQYEKAINILKEYANTFKDDSVYIMAKIGKLFALLKDYNMAREYFLKVVNKKDDLLKLGDDTLYAIAKTFEEKGDLEYALSVYNKVYNIFPNSKYADLAMYNAALILEKMKKEKLANSLLLDCKNRYPEKLGGQKAAVHYAEKFLKDHPTEYWIEFLSNVLNSMLDINLTAKAERLIIESYVREKRYEEALNKINSFEAKYFDTPELNKVFEIKQKIYFYYANRYFNEGKFDLSKSYINELLKEFPETAYKDEALKLLEKMALIQAEKIYDSKQYEKVMEYIQDYMIKHKKIYYNKKWNKILEEAYYHLIKNLIKDNFTEKAAALAKEYLIYFPNGKYKDELFDFLSGYLIKNMMNLVKNGSYAGGIKFFNQNSEWIEKLPSKEDKAILEGYLSFCYFKLGDYSTSRKIYNKIKGFDFSVINMLGILFGEKVSTKNVNKLSDNDLKMIFDELKIENKDLLYKVLTFYRKNLILKYRLLYELIITFDDNRRVVEIKKLYNKLKELELIDKFPEVVLERGIIAFKEKDYKTAIRLFEDYVKKDGKKSDMALYFLGKSYVELGENEKGADCFNDLIDKYGDSFYARLAEKELKEINWLKNLNQQR